MRIVGPLQCAAHEHWALLPVFLDRVQNFCAKYPTDLLFETLREFVIAAFRNPTPNQPMGAILIVDETGAAVGHALSSIEPRGKERVAFVVQYQVDRPVPVALRAAIMDCLRVWAAPHKVAALECITWLPPKVLERYGFTSYRTIMRAPVEVSNG